LPNPWGTCRAIPMVQIRLTNPQLSLGPDF
jgi:hypothetical protein